MGGCVSSATLTSLFTVIDSVYDALEPVKDEIPELTIYKFMHDAPSPPALDFYPAPVFQTGGGFGAGNNQMFWIVRARAQWMDLEAAQTFLYRLLDPTDPASVEVALANANLTVEEVSGFTLYGDDAPLSERMVGCDWKATTFL